MLFGGFDHKIDKKGRVFIPSTFREDLGEQFMICRYVLGNKYCLCIYSKEQWEAFVKKIDTYQAQNQVRLSVFCMTVLFQWSLIPRAEY